MPLTVKQLTPELETIIDPSLAEAIIQSFVELEQRFLFGEWQPAELDGRRLFEAVARACYQLDTGILTHSMLPNAICDKLEDARARHPHNLSREDRIHISKVIRLVYGFRSDRGSVHISPAYKSDYMDSILLFHAGKWILAEFLRLAWKDKTVIAETIAEFIQLEHYLTHQFDGTPLNLDETVSDADVVAPIQLNKIGRS